MKTVPEPPGNSFEPLGKPIRPEAKPTPTAPVPTENSRIGRRLDGMLETLIPGNEGKVPKSDFAERGPWIQEDVERVSAQEQADSKRALRVGPATQYHFAGSAVGRMSSSRPALQSLPKSAAETLNESITDCVNALCGQKFEGLFPTAPGTSTGRLSSSEPVQVHQLPKADDFAWARWTPHDFRGV